MEQQERSIAEFIQDACILAELHNPVIYPRVYAKLMKGIITPWEFVHEVCELANGHV